MIIPLIKLSIFLALALASRAVERWTEYILEFFFHFFDMDDEKLILLPGSFFRKIDMQQLNNIKEDKQKNIKLRIKIIVKVIDKQIKNTVQLKHYFNTNPKVSLAIFTIKNPLRFIINKSFFLSG